MIEDCIGRGMSVQEGGAVYNFTGPQGFGIANMADSLYAIKTLVYDEQKLSMADLRDALANNFGKLHAPEEAEEITKNLAKAFVADGVSLTEEQVRTMYQTCLLYTSRCV